MHASKACIPSLPHVAFVAYSAMHIGLAVTNPTSMCVQLKDIQSHASVSDNITMRIEERAACMQFHYRST